jgi:hypothetical protein
LQTHTTPYLLFHSNKKDMYAPTATPPPLSFHAALSTPVSEAQAREAFGVIRVVVSWDPDDRVIHLPVPTNDDVLQTMKILYNAFESSHNTEDHTVFLLKGPGVSRWYTVVVCALLAYRASHPGGDPIPWIWIVDADMRPLPNMVSKAYVWRYHLHTSGHMSTTDLMAMAHNLRIRYGGLGGGQTHLPMGNSSLTGQTTPPMGNSSLTGQTTPPMGHSSVTGQTTPQMHGSSPIRQTGERALSALANTTVESKHSTIPENTSHIGVQTNKMNVRPQSQPLGGMFNTIEKKQRIDRKIAVENKIEKPGLFDTLGCTGIGCISNSDNK